MTDFTGPAAGLKAFIRELRARQPDACLPYFAGGWSRLALRQVTKDLQSQGNTWRRLPLSVLEADVKKSTNVDEYSFGLLLRFKGSCIVFNNSVERLKTYAMHSKALMSKMPGQASRMPALMQFILFQLL